MTKAAGAGVGLQPPRQLQLFPLDPWGAESTFTVMDRPCPAIARALVGPLRIGEPLEATHEPLRCLAVSRDGTFAACTTIRPAQLASPGMLWSSVAQALQTASRQPVRPPAGWLDNNPRDSLAAWSAPAFWLRQPERGDPVHRAVRAMASLLRIRERGTQACLGNDDWHRLETDAQALIEDQMRAGVSQLVRALHPELRRIATNRPRLSLSMAHRVLQLAIQHTPAAVPYAWQALRTESVGVLHLIASGHPEPEAAAIRLAIFSGASLPRAMTAIGIPKSAYRRSLQRPHPPPGPGQPNEGLGDLPLAGDDWLAAMRLTQDHPPRNRQDWACYGRLLARVSSLKLWLAATAPTLIRWCLCGGHAQSNRRLTLVITQAQAFVSAAKILAARSVLLDDAISLALATARAVTEVRPGRAASVAILSNRLNPSHMGQRVAGVAHLCRLNIDTLMADVFKAHPGIPAHFRPRGPYTLRPLDRFDLVTAHGAVCRVCLSEPAIAVDYLASGAALYAVESATGPVGTIALRRSDAKTPSQVQAKEVTGMLNAVPSAELRKLANHLARSWNTTRAQARWASHEQACNQWRRLLDMQ